MEATTSISSVLLSNAIFITLMAAGIAIWIVGLFVSRNQPKKPNSTYGYRTKRSKSSQEAWDFSQEYSTRLLIKAAQLLCLLACISLFFEVDEVVGSLIATCILIGVLLFPILMTEKALKEKFPN